MDKEHEPIFESGYSEEELDKQANKLTDQNQVKAVNIFDPSKNNKQQKKDEES